VLELLKLLGFIAWYNSIHSKAQDLSEADVIINHFAELNFEKVTFIQSKLGIINILNYLNL
jgi:hypothetical protein